MKDTYHKVKNMKDPTGRLRSSLFLVQPDSALYPDYYTIITTPMDFQTIEQKLQEQQYQTIQEYEQDFTLMFKNAQTYNPPESLVHYDSVVMNRSLTTKVKKFKKQYHLS